MDAVRPAETNGFTRFAYLVLAYTMAVVLWGAYVRATGSGAGCGNHWPLCNGEVIPRVAEATTLIEFTHRVTSGGNLLLAAILAVWAFRVFPRGYRVRRFVVLAVVLLGVEALLGAGLVLLEFVAHNASRGRAAYLAAHLVNTQLLLAMLLAAAWFSHRDAVPRPRCRPWLAIAALPVALLISVTGALAALGDTLWLAGQAAGGPASSQAAEIVRLRLLHPFVAMLAGGFLMWAVLGTAQRETDRAARLARVSVAALVLLQWLAGAVNVILRAPVWMQLVHLQLANFMWLALVIYFLQTQESGEERA
jgi:heme A synthase